MSGILEDQEELNNVLSQELENEPRDIGPTVAPAEYRGTKDKNIGMGYVQWTTNDDRIFIPSSRSVEKLVPGFYEIKSNDHIGIYFELIEVNNEHLVRFPDSNSEKVMQDIEKFWQRKDLFKKYSLTYKRGVLMWGPPGTGKTCTVRQVMEDVVKRGGIVIKFNKPELFNAGFKPLRAIQPDTPVVVLMEDIDSTLEHTSESDVINILDGVGKTDNVVFLATTNYPEKLGARIVNRPSRFDRRMKIGNLNEDARMLYFKHLFDVNPELLKKYDVTQWVKDTEGLSIAHLKELFISVVIIGDSYEESIQLLKSMRDTLSNKGDAVIGFRK